MTNEIDESESIDEVKLLIVYHAPGLAVLADMLGTPHSLSHPIAPDLAYEPGFLTQTIFREYLSWKKLFPPSTQE